MARNEFQKRIGVGERNLALATSADTRRRAVIVEEGPRRGQVGGYHTDHSDGRVDATVFSPALNIKTRAQEI